MRALIPLLLLAACSQPNHLAVNPASVITTAAENVAYGARRAQVKTYLQANASATRAGDPGTLTALWDIARTPPPPRARIAAEVAEIPAGPEWAERATVVVMALSG